MLEMFSSFVKVETALDIDSERRLVAHFLLPFHFCLRYIGKYILKNNYLYGNITGAHITHHHHLTSPIIDHDVIHPIHSTIAEECADQYMAKSRCCPHNEETTTI